ncbi:MAG TPA: polymer-forming cytoskeletal protein [Thermodesulfobacteriota bacterium]|nr:polymer-forming cytoskeletal protein [Thermodesulfobacteriota bacterium]
MFSKETDKLETFLGMNSSFKGELNVRGTLRIDGTAEGQLDADYVILSEPAEVKGEIKAKKILIGGKMDGNVHAQELVEIKSKGKVLGDIFTPKLAIIEGGEFNGKVEMKKAEMKRGESKVIELELKGREVGKP